MQTTFGSVETWQWFLTATSVFEHIYNEEAKTLSGTMTNFITENDNL